MPRCATAVVDEQGGARLPGLLLAAHHELAGVGAAAPVHPAQVVAAAVLAHRDVLRAARGEGPGPVVAGPGPGTRQRHRRQRHDAGRHHQRRGGTERPVELDQAERVAEPHLHRADLEAAADVGADLVADGALPARAHPVDTKRGRVPST